MGFQPQYPDLTTPPKQSEEPKKADAEAESAEVVQGLDLLMNTSPLVGDPLDLASSERLLASLEASKAEQAIPTDELILETEAEAYAEQMGSSEAPTDEAVEVEAALTPARMTRIELLTLAIESYPQSPANYVVRGEAYLEQHEYGLAEQDFLMALELSEQGAETADWGYIHRAFYDRAKEGLRHCR